MGRPTTFNSRRSAKNTLALLPFLLGAVPAAANDGTAQGIMNALKAEERYPFIAGMVEALAYDRYTYNNKDEQGMTCIVDWFYGKKGALDEVYAAFGQFPTYPPAAVLASLTKEACGE